MDQQSSQPSSSALGQAQGFIQLSTRAVIQITSADSENPPDIGDFLQNLVTQEISPTKNGEVVFSALLTPQGKILFDFFVLERDDAFYLDCNASIAADLVKRLKLYKLRLKINLEIREELAVAITRDDALTADGANDKDLFVYEDPRHEALGVRAIGPREGFEKDAEREAKWNAKRISLCVAQGGDDFAPDEIFLMDVNYDALAGVSYQKGCFIGQEVASRMKRKGNVRKRTLLVKFDGAPPAKRTSITAGASTLGKILSGVSGGALALVRLDRLEAAIEQNLELVADGVGVTLLLPDYLKGQS